MKYPRPFLISVISTHFLNSFRQNGQFYGSTKRHFPNLTVFTGPKNRRKKNTQKHRKPPSHTKIEIFKISSPIFLAQVSAFPWSKQLTTSHEISSPIFDYCNFCSCPKKQSQGDLGENMLATHPKQFSMKCAHYFIYRKLYNSQLQWQKNFLIAF